ncbi:Palmitoyltransferase akr1 [Dirofilaria immitis]
MKISRIMMLIVVLVVSSSSSSNNDDDDVFVVLLKLDNDPSAVVSAFLETAQSRAATGGVYKGQGRNQRELMTHTY